MPWDWNGTETVIGSRTTNEYGEIQSTVEGLAKLWGDDFNPPIPAADVLHWWETAPISSFLNNPIQLWKVKPDGSVFDATYVKYLPNPYYPS